MQVRGGVWLLLGTLCGAPSAAADCAHRAPREAALDAAGATRVEVRGRAGSLRVVGVPGAARVTASGTACASRESRLAELRISARREGTTLRVEAEVPESSWPFDEAHLDLVVEVPDALAVQVTDSSGDLEVRGVASLVLEDRSGGITVEDVAGDVSVRDGSGSLRLTGVRGNVRVHDGSGSIDIRRVGGDVEIEDDGSGGIDIADVTGSVLVREDGSGGIDVHGVGGDFTVERNRSGGIRHRDVRGRVSLPTRRRR